ncbi:MAG TPA: hypothetical protein VLT33_02915 [Labilithrix sp.]|nr:hypothetical protein [Labilithrix sp.]
MRVLRAAATAVVMVLLAAGARAAVHHEPRVRAVAPGVATATTTATASAESPASAAGGELSSDLALAALAPIGADAPGTDSPVAGRPGGATRLLDTALDAQGSRLRVYAASASQESLEPALARAVVGQGFARTRSVDPATVTFARRNDHVVLRFARRDDRTIVSIVELGFRVAPEDR